MSFYPSIVACVYELRSAPEFGLLLLRRAESSWGASAGNTVVNLQSSTISILFRQHLQSLGGTFDIDEIGVGEASRLSTSSIDGDSDVDNVPDISEEFVEIFIRHPEAHVANEECPRRWIARGEAFL